MLTRDGSAITLTTVLQDMAPGQLSLVIKISSLGSIFTDSAISTHAAGIAIDQVVGRARRQMTSGSITTSQRTRAAGGADSLGRSLASNLSSLFGFHVDALSYMRN